MKLIFILLSFIWAFALFGKFLILVVREIEKEKREKRLMKKIQEGILSKK